MMMNHVMTDDNKIYIVDSKTSTLENSRPPFNDGLFLMHII